MKCVCVLFVLLYAICPIITLDCLLGLRLCFDLIDLFGFEVVL